ncbi:MarR family transcriptional regulator [Acinetobacter gerneri]|uniref:MarR family transcriptional regulator n=1 Tax=Acinetobacter gerneri TaxID=202952 RepID=UPI0032141D44
MSHFVPNSFQVPNAFVDDVLSQISDAACKIYLIINRKTRGWTKEMDSISLSQLEAISGKSRPTVIRAKNELIKFGLVLEMPSTSHGNTYKLGDETGNSCALKFPSKNILLGDFHASASKDFLPVLVKNFNYASKKTLLLLVKNFYTHKTTIKNNSTKNKKINKKSSSVSEKPKTENQNIFDPKSIELPENVNRDLWDQFVDMRIEMKKPLTEKAVSLAVKKLAAYGQSANQTLETSIIGGYQGIYPPKQQNQPHSNPQQPQPTKRFGSYGHDQQNQMRDVGGYSNV